LEGAANVRVFVDWDKCESNGLCMGAAPEVFELQDDDTLEVLQETPDDSQSEAVAAAIRVCPKQAISLRD
jgi:ferredoxin